MYRSLRDLNDQWLVIDETGPDYIIRFRWRILAIFHKLWELLASDSLIGIIWPIRYFGSIGTVFSSSAA